MAPPEMPQMGGPQGALSLGIMGTAKDDLRMWLRRGLWRRAWKRREARKKSSTLPPVHVDDIIYPRRNLD